MNQEDFADFFTKLLVETEKSEDPDDLFSLHNSIPDTSVPDQDQSPISEPPTSAPPTQDQAETTSVYDTPFEEAVPLEDELANLLDDID
jgi:hypothetical protein